MNKSNSPKKIKRYRLGVSRNFPTTHVRKGEPTYFVEKILRHLIKGANMYTCNYWDKLHTIRSNYSLWEKRMKEVQEGRAVIELFYWSGKPYNSPQVVFATLDKDSGCGVQRLGFSNNRIDCLSTDKPHPVGLSVENLAKNDGLSLEDFKEWFKGYDLSEPMAIIHFTNFRY